MDTRTEEEFATSHLPGAINWPDYKSGELPIAAGQHVGADKPVVFYCSIGYRSGEATVRAAKLLDPNAKLFNLRGGIFQWANEGGPLEGGDRVHGYDEEWGQLLKPERRADSKKPL
ncbi:MAG: rhodanese-like domain-containing protein [Vicinamibacteria bacterium]|nr:rhodanese-like domain-containing protein [Vicinamibacteria bacterium]